MKKPKAEKSPSVFTVDVMIAKAIKKINEAREAQKEAVSELPYVQSQIITNPSLTLDKDSILQTLAGFAAEYIEEKSFTKHFTINGEAISHLILMYKAIDEIFQWVEMDGLVEILLDSFREGFRNSNEHSQYTEKGLKEKMNQLFQIQVTLASMLKLEKSYIAFENILES